MARTETTWGSLPRPRVVAGPSFELIAQLSAFTSGPARASLESGKGWIREVRDLAGPELIRAVERWSIALYGELVSVALEAGPPYRPEQLVRTVRAMRPILLWQRLLGAESAPNRAMVSRGAFERATAGDPEARSEILEALSHDGSSRQSIERLLATPPELAQLEVAAILETWAKRVFPAFGPAAMALVARDVETKERLFAESAAGDALRVAIGGVSFESTDWIRDIAVVPAVAIRPFVVPVDWRSTAIILCSVADEAFDADPAAPPRRLVKAAAALGDALRLRVLHELGDEELSASELADRLGVDRTSLHHHLGILRSAGLVSVRVQGLQGWRYSVPEDGIAATTAALAGYLRATSQRPR